jgi:hypothetical protein
VNPTQRHRLAIAVPGALAAGGVAGAGVGLHWYGPAIGVELAILIGLAAGIVVLRTALEVKRGRSSSGGQGRCS